MFKNATLLRLVRSDALSLDEARSRAAASVFSPTASTQQKSVGWLQPRGDPGSPFVEVIAGNWIMAAMIETRAVPANAIAKRVDELAAAIEKDTGRKPGRKQRQELKGEALLELLPRAFPKPTRVLVWIDQAAGIVALDTASTSVSDDVASLLAQTLPLAITPLSTNMAPASIMNGWLHDGAPDYDEFELGEACELRATDDSKAGVRYTNTALDCDEVKQHVRAGKVATDLALCWQGRAWFTLTDGLVLKHLEVMGDAKALDTPPSEVDSAFDADAAIFCGEMRPLLADLIAAMDGLATQDATAEVAA